MNPVIFYSWPWPLLC